MQVEILQKLEDVSVNIFHQLLFSGFQPLGHGKNGVKSSNWDEPHAVSILLYMKVLFSQHLFFKLVFILFEKRLKFIIYIYLVINFLLVSKKSQPRGF